MSANDVLTFDYRAARINANYALAVRHGREALRHFVLTGNDLRAVHDSLSHGEWLAWVRTHCHFTVRQAQRLVRLAEQWPAIESKCDTVSHLPNTVRGALALIAKPRTELGEADELARRWDEIVLKVRLLGFALDSAITAASDDLDLFAHIALEANRLHAELAEIQSRALREVGRLSACIQSRLPGVAPEEIAAACASGLLVELCEARMAELSAAP